MSMADWKGFREFCASQRLQTFGNSKRPDKSQEIQ